MEKAIFALLLAFGIQAGAQTTGSNTGGAGTQSHTGSATGVKIPPTVNTRFGADNPNVSPNWSVDGNNYSATFTDQSTSTSRRIVYDTNGNIIRSENQMNPGTYPGAIGEYYSKNYPNEKYAVWSSMDNKGTTMYYTKRNGKLIWFDQKGNYLPGNTNTSNSSTSGTTK